MITKKTQDYDVTTKTHQITDNATGEAGKVAYTTFASEDKELSNDYIIPFHAIDNVVVKITNGTKEVEDDTCITGDEPTPPTPDEPRIEGVTDTVIKQGSDFDPTDGVKAYDGEGNEIPFTVDPDTFDKCLVGEQAFTYTYAGKTKTRTVTVEQIADPTINGLSELTVEVGEEFDPLEGVSAVDGNGNDISVEVVA